MVSPPTGSEVSRIADWIELFVLTTMNPISKAKILSLLNKEIEVDENDIDSAFLELNRRLQLYGDNAPYDVFGNIVEPKFGWQEMPEHTLCLYYSTYGAAKPDDGTKLFEEITKACLENFLGAYGYCFGAPSTKGFKEQLNEFAIRVRQKRFEDPNPHDKDRDVDIVLAKEFDQNRDNQIMIFVQCAAGKNWDEKKPVAIESYRRFMSFTLKAIVSSLALTQIVTLDEWRNATDDYGLVLDRARLYRMYSLHSEILDDTIQQRIIDWCTTRLAG